MSDSNKNTDMLVDIDAELTPTTTSTDAPDHVLDKENIRDGSATGTGTATSGAATTTAAGAAATGGGGYHMPWVEKYRPRTLADVLGNEDTIVRLQSIAQTGNMPNLILSGPPGTGKTTSVHALARELLGPIAYKDAVLELNASDARGIDVVRNRIKSFAMNKVTLPPGRHKIIILDEADSMTNAAQQALRRTMELFSNTTRFCFACNMSTKIIEAIQSRAAILRYSRLSDDQILSCLLNVCQKEHISYTNDGLEAILFTAEGDMRQALNNLQASYYLTTGGIINQNTVFRVCDQPHPKIIGIIITCCQQGDTKTAIVHMQSLHRTGYSASDIIGTIFKVVKARIDLSEAMKLEYLREIGFTQLRIADGVNTPLQLYGLVARLSQLGRNTTTSSSSSKVQ